MIRNALALMLAATVVSGCAVNPDAQTDDEGIVDESEDAIAAKKLEGTWDSTDGRIYSITFTNDYAETLGGGLKGKRFAATIDTGKRCIKAPCDGTTMEGSGVYKLTGGYRLTLASYDRPSLELSRALGEYNAYLLKNGDLSLTRRDSGVKQTFQKRPAPSKKCGKNTCGTGTYCCNPLMSLCVPDGNFCAL